MNNIDSLVRIEFSPETAMIMNICIGFLMFGIALDMKVSDFRKVVEYPKSVVVGLASQLLLLPILTIVLIKLWGPIPSVALGLIMIASCPGGNISNFAVHLGKGNTALSVTLTSIVTIFAIIITPLSFSLWAMFLPETHSILSKIKVDQMSMFRIIGLVLLVPLIAGMWFNHRFGKISARIRKPIRTISLLMFTSFIFFAVFANRVNIVKYLELVFLLVVVHNILALSVGYSFARLNRRTLKDSKAISMETGVQNAGLGLILILNFFGEYGGMMLVAAFWGVWNLISALALGLFWNYKSKLVVQT
jgi:bile acid:Na+ symporter, BASS family